MISANVSTHAAFFARGLLGYNQPHLMEAYNGGMIELVSGMSRYAEDIEKMVEIVEATGSFDFPGVLDYEVSEPFGEWYGKEILKGDGDPSRAEELII